MSRVRSRISSKVIAHPPDADAACRSRWGNWQSHAGAVIPHMVDKRKQEVLGAHDPAVTPCSQTRGGLAHGRVGVEVLVQLWRGAASQHEATRRRWQRTWVGDDAGCKKDG